MSPLLEPWPVAGNLNTTGAMASMKSATVDGSLAIRNAGDSLATVDASGLDMHAKGIKHAGDVSGVTSLDVHGHVAVQTRPYGRKRLFCALAEHGTTITHEITGSSVADAIL